MGYEVSIQKTNKGQFTVTIPKAIAELLEVKRGQKAQWKLSKGSLELRFS